MARQIDWTKSKPTLVDCLRFDIQLHERSLELAINNRRYSIYRTEHDFQESLNLIRERLVLKRSFLAHELLKVGG